MINRGVLDHFGAESVAHLLAEPGIFAKASGRMSAFVGERLAQAIPAEVIDKVDSLISGFLLSSAGDDPDPEFFEFPHVLSVIANADHVHSKNIGLIFIEGTVATGAIALAGAGGPFGAFCAAVAEMPINYTLVLQRSFEIQKAFHLRPTVERTNRAFSVATAVSRIQRYEACFGERTSMFAGMLARKVMAQHGRTFYPGIKEAASSSLGRIASRSIAGEAVDNGADQSARMMLLSGFRTFCQGHPQLMAIAMPVAGAVVGGSWSAWSARGMMLASYHLSRLEYLEQVRLRMDFRALTEGNSDVSPLKFASIRGVSS